MSAIHEYILERYDTMCRLPELRRYFGDTDFMNFGYWDDATQDQKQACEQLMERLLAFIPEKHGRILDVACGKGQTTHYLLRYFPATAIVGINLSAEQLAVARGNAPLCTFRQMSAEQLDFEASSFDNIICVEAAFHFDTRECFLQEALRVLRPGGYLVLSDILFSVVATRAKPALNWGVHNISPDILFSVVATRAKPSIAAENFLADAAAYRLLLHRLGFEGVDIVDATATCWIAHFWYAVKYFHNLLLHRQISKEQLLGYLDHTYVRAHDIEHYLLIAARKPR